MYKSSNLDIVNLTEQPVLSSECRKPHVYGWSLLCLNRQIPHVYSHLEVLKLQQSFFEHLIGYLVFHAVSAVFQSYNDNCNLKKNPTNKWMLWGEI